MERERDRKKGREEREITHRKSTGFEGDEQKSMNVKK